MAAPSCMANALAPSAPPGLSERSRNQHTHTCTNAGPGICHTPPNLGGVFWGGVAKQRLHTHVQSPAQGQTSVTLHLTLGACSAAAAHTGSKLLLGMEALFWGGMDIGVHQCLPPTC